MAKAPKKKTAVKGKKATAKKVAAKVKKAAKSLKKKVAPKKPAKPAKKPVAKKPAPKKAAAKVKKIAKAAKKAVAKVAPKPAPKPAAKPVPKLAAKPAAKPKGAPEARTTPTPPPPAARPKAPEPEKKRGRRARPRVQSSGAPVAAWLSTEKPRSASFIPAPPRAEAPSAVAAPPASSDRLIRPEDVAQPAVRTVPVRIDVEQGAGHFLVFASPLEVAVRVGEGIEWDFRYVGGADVMCDDIVIEFDRPSPFSHTTFRSRRPGGARPHRQLSGGAVASAAGKRVQYTVRAMSAYKTELASTKVWATITV